MIIKKFNGTSWIDQPVKTTTRSIHTSTDAFASPSEDDYIFDTGHKIKAAHLPDFVFGGLKFYGTITANTSLPDLTTTIGTDLALDDLTAYKGYYWVVTTAVDVTSQSDGEFADDAWDDGVAPDQGELSLEAGDWVVITGESGASGLLYSVVNNTYAQGTNSVAGVLKITGTPANGSTDTAINSDWAYDHTAALNPHNTKPTDLAAGNNWKVYYTNGSGVVTELGLGGDNTVLKSTGGTSAPEFAAIAYDELTGTPTIPDEVTDLSGGNWKVFYTNGSGVVTELTVGADNTVLKSTGGTSAPEFAAIDYSEIANTPSIPTGFSLTDSILDGGTNSYQVYSSGDKAAGRLYSGTTDPTNTTRLNYDGYFYAKKLYSEGSEVLTTLPSHNHTITANATDGIFDITGTNGTNAVTYAVAPYTAGGTAGQFNTDASTDPTGSTRLNWEGNFHATKYYRGPNEMLPVYYGTLPTDSTVPSGAFAFV